MGDSRPEMEMADALEDFDESELLDSVPEFDDKSEISAVIRTAFEVGSAVYTLPASDDEEAPEVTCLLSEEFPDERVTSASRTVGHGLRQVVAAEHFEGDEDTPSVVIRIEI